MSPPSRLRVRVICHDLGRGGAARATTRLIEALGPRQAELGLDLSVRTAGGPPHPLALPQALPGGAAQHIRRASHYIRHRLDMLPSSTTNEGLHSRADVWTGIGRETNRAPLDVVNIHWVGTGTMSIGEIGRLRQPVVMTLHDMWALSGSEHYAYDDRFRHGYSRDSRPIFESGIDWNRLTWLRKNRQWNNKKMHVITPSNWLADCVRSSMLMADWPTTVIPYALDTETWAPVDRRVARAELGLPSDATLILFGADGGTAHSIKGGDLLEAALWRLPSHLSIIAQRHQDIRLVTFGGGDRSEPAGRLPFPVIHLGRVDTDERMRAAYSACDVMVVPSRLDNLPSTATEAQACGTPVVAFAVGGLPDIVDDWLTGRLIDPFDTDQLAQAVAWITLEIRRNRALGTAGRNKIRAMLNPDKVAVAHAEVYRAHSSA